MTKTIIRVQSPEGTKRVDVYESDTLSSLYDKIHHEFDIDESRRNEWTLYSDRNKNLPISHSKSTRALEIVSHGDIIYLFQSAPIANPDLDHGEEDDVDAELAKQDGLISRDRDPQLCHHGPSGKCIHCVPVESYDLDYLKKINPSIKYISFNAYLKKLHEGGNKAKYLSLENLNCKIKPGCKEHPAWPKGICNKCQPPTIYLNQQVYRHVDNIMFENGQIVEKFLNYWRRSGNQRVGFLFGRYEAYDGIPLGIKAVVSAIYEPPQITTESSVQLELPDPNEEKVFAMAKKLGLKCVGWIFTDLLRDDTGKGVVKHYRGDAKTFFLSSDECIMAGYFQNKFKNYSRYSSDGYFGSKFVTVVVTGDSNNQIHFEGYQVSNQCASLVRDECIIPTYDVPQLAYIRESSNEKYIPDVYFREKDQYNNEVTKIARPLPVEYLILDLPAAFAKEPTYTFNEGNLAKEPFPIENRADIGESQDFNSLKSYMKQFPPYRFIDAMSDFHLLIFLVTNQTVSIESTIDTLLDAIKSKNAQKANEWAKTPEWSTIEHFLVEGTSTVMVEEWQCEMCTYLNEDTFNECQMCQTPRIRN
ncbi:unnamed protein product [Brachionus calyciflorus]|uniref:Uncharacterized protein n=1 Tax=Brachionus calyciflorus TaxID=104777 RepID=A0A814DAA9_9BILA|nr:unnamed protein product [Brachionus calyciflorus]